MLRTRTSLPGLLLALAWPAGAAAQSPDPAPAPAVAPAPDPSTDPDVDAELRSMAEAQERGEGEVVEIFEARPRPPIERGTDVRLTYEQLVARGATDLASALRLLPDVTVRDAGRGGFNIDVRGGRKGSVTVLIDGMAVTDPYYGTFDVSSIPVTDIVQIRMSPNPQSPLDGPGGSAGVIEVLTRDAIGKQLVIARLTGDSLPSFGATGMARVALARHLALRISMSGEAGSREHDLPGTATINEDRHASTGSARLEYRRGKRRIALDGFLDSRHYVAPPNEDIGSDIVLIDRELSARASVKGDDELGALQLQGQAYTHYLARRSRHFSDHDLENEVSFEDLHATRTGGAAVAAHPLGRRGRGVLSVIGSREHAQVTDWDKGRGEQVTRGGVTMIEAAGGLKYETTRWQLDGAAGVALPMGVDADPWPEARLVAKYRLRKDLELAATGARKGRVPSLRERFDPRTGNPEIDPEKAWHGELRATFQPGERLRLEAAPFYRRATGIIRLVDAPTQEEPDRRINDNLDLVTFLGVDAQARVRPHRMIEVGGSYSYIRARGEADDPVMAMAPLDRLPSHRADGWVQVTPDRRISVQARARYFGESIDKRATIPGYTTLEATITAPLTRQYLGVLRIDDLTDVRPETRTGYYTAGRVISLIVQATWE
ncbi:MAG TPA: TonB-dependent receptor [Kofleriaceae bacterium]|nr:TonB-dependent receptor [Kofleriaceae bacterium]